ncbi:MAG TPA: T9SS type A sorting domain-containing protein [Rhodothermales bacterium]|nr:T9SS type A sorting domain-containing protein [Rhodothermales bacterium]
MKTRKLVLVLWIAAQCSAVLAQPQNLVDQFQRRSQTLDGFTLNYRLFVPPDYDAEVSYPLVLALHGSGERGADNERHIANHRLATAWADPATQARHPSIVVAPQAPPGGDWSSDSEDAPIRPELATTYAILDSLKVEFNVDPDRVYITGLSMGGFGTLEAVVRSQDQRLFAAAVPMSGGGSPIFAPDYGDMPFWFVHGEIDNIVPPEWSRDLVFALEELGRDAVYTHCGPFTCSQLSESELEAALEQFPNLIYTGLPAGGHVIWAPWYNNPRLQDWVFAQHRLLPGAISIKTPRTSPSDPNLTEIRWNAPNPDDRLELWFRQAPGQPWELIADTVANDGAWDLFTGDMPDSPLARVRLMLIDADGFVYARSDSEPFSIDAPGNGVPFVDIQDFQFRSGDEVTENQLVLHYVAADVESDTLHASLLYSVDDGASFSLVGDLNIMSRRTVRELGLDLANLANSKTAVLRLEISDGEFQSADQTPVFSKQTPRFTSVLFDHPAGASTGSIIVNFVQPSELTGHRYRVTFDVDSNPFKTYSVRNLNVDVEVLSAIPVSSAESPVFDGIRLLINDIPRASMDTVLSRWSDSAVTLEVSASAPRVNIGGTLRDLLATPEDYELSISTEVVDTSSALFGFPEKDLRFTVENLSHGSLRDILFMDPNGNGYPDRGETFYVVEQDENDQPFPAWLFTFSGVGEVVPPGLGARFTFVTRKPISGDDVFEFVGMISVGAEDEELPRAFELSQNYPNPFSTRTTISYTLADPRHVKLTLHDALGRTVREVLDDRVGAGSHRVEVDASDLASGVYFYRMEAGESVEVRRLVVVR